ncbi:MAG: zinc ribbon domain-containing protein [Candidatus Heimdallarchaeota archaeon]|nr:zinc ribbon domain-containing protein [Candidatus Heimdallarchaeota archaeon]
MQERRKAIYTYILIFISLLVFYSFARVYDPILALLFALLFLGYSFYFYLRYFRFIILGIFYSDSNTRGQIGIKQGDTYMVIVTFIILYIIEFSIFNWLLDDAGLSLLISGFLSYGIYLILYYFAGKDDRERLFKQQRRREQFVEAIKPKEGTCLSCFRKLDEEQRFCDSCGFDNQR